MQVDYTTFDLNSIFDHHNSGYCTNSTWSKYNKYDEIVSKINDIGTISPQGEIIETPAQINLELCSHQKRTLYEMILRETYKYKITSGFNVLMLCDNVGSGKSIEILSLIAERPTIDTLCENSYRVSNKSSDVYSKNKLTGFKYSSKLTEFKSNLLIIPHNIYNQWISYISNNTELSYYAVGCKKNIIPNKAQLLNKLNTVNIVCVKSTMLKHFIAELNEHFGEPSDPILVKSKSNASNSTKIGLINTISNISAWFKDAFTQDEKSENLEDIVNEFKVSIDNTTNQIDYDYLKESANIVKCDYNLKLTGGYIFQRVIVDEVDSIKIPAFPNIYGKYFWLITSSIHNILYPCKKVKYIDGKYIQLSNGIPGSGFLKSIINDSVDACRYGYSNGFHSSRVFKTVIRNNIDFVKDSIYIPDPIYNYIKCFTPNDLQIVSSVISKDALKAFNAGDVNTAVSLLGCSVGTENDIIKIVTNKLYEDNLTYKAKINEKEILFEEQKSLLLEINDLIDSAKETNNTELLGELKEHKKNTRSTHDSLKTSIDTWTVNLQNNENKIKGITDRIAGIKDKKCPICCMSMTKPCMTPCCKNIFCMSCIGTAVNLSNKNECPMCRTAINIKELNIIVDSENPSLHTNISENKLPTKNQALLNYLNENKTERIMLFSEYQNTFETIIQLFKNNNITYSQLNGSSSRIDNIVSKFRKKEFQVLLLNAKHFGAGLNLQFTDRILVYHRMSKDLESQLIGRAQRMGRSTSLNINYLCYDNEYPENT